MFWNLDITIFAFLLLTPILLDIRTHSSHASVKEVLFSRVAFFSAFLIVFCAATYIALAFIPAQLPLARNLLFLIHYLLWGLLPPIWLRYMLSSPTFRRRPPRGKTLILLYAPYVIYALVLGGLFVREWLLGAMSGLSFGDGAMFWAMVGLFAAQIAMFFALFVRLPRQADRNYVLTLLCFPAISLVFLTLQRVQPRHPMLGGMAALFVIVGYLLLQHRKIFVDPLTALANRQALRQTLEKHIASNRRGHIIVLSLSGFKFFNQLFGQHNGDRMLKAIALFLGEVADKQHVYRYGDDKFATVLPESTGAQVRALTECISARFRTAWLVDGTSYIQSACVATVGYPLRENTDMDIFSAMDFALYDAKRRSITQVYDDGSLLMSVRRRHEVFQALKRAMAKNSFEVYYQPIYCLKHDRFENAEALLRLRDPILGPVSPAEFIPIAEENGLIVDMTLCFTRKICDFLNSIHLPEYFEGISINLSAVQLMQEGMADDILSIINDTNMPPGRLKFEVTETVLAESFEKMRAGMYRMAESGISFSLDDYGTGYSNLAYLLSLPFSIVKIDRSIVASAVSDSTLVDCVITMVHKLGKEAIAEGVETREVSDILRNLSCDHIQGYYYSHPLSQEAFHALIRGNNTFLLDS